MTKRLRPVDRAIQSDRPAKSTVRSLWLGELNTVAQLSHDPEVPLYLTLPGSEGRDILMMIQSGLIKQTEVGSIAEDDVDKVVAVEQDNSAIASLNRILPGLRIKEVQFRNLVRSEGPFSWPEGEDIRFCRALVVNLDLNQPLSAQLEGQDIIF